MDYISVGLFLFFIMVIVINIFATVLNDYKEWFEEFRGYNICEILLVFTLFLPTTIIFVLIYVLSIKPFKKRSK